MSGAGNAAVPRARAVVLVLLVALLAVLMAWHALRYASGPATLAIAVAVLPWLAPLRGLLAGNRRTYAIASLLAIPYLGYGLMEVLANPGARGYAGATVFLAFGLFIALIAYLRVSRPAPPAPSARTAP
ncbi:MAG: DUF2069 domain-containing protein [Steroidobacteraceae bacterium]|nr:DUF2069 domain-containing protein [Steroidobacteraceae bacterium]